MALFEGASDEEGLNRAKKRIERLGQAALLDWMEAALPGMQRHLDMYRRTGDRSHLGEIAIAEMTLSLVVTQLIKEEE